MENYEQICSRLTLATCKKETHRIATRAMYKYGELSNVLILNKKENNKWHRKSL